MCNPMRKLSQEVACGFLVFVASTAGCTVNLKGGGELGIGFRTDSFIILRHVVDGDKQDIQAQAKLDLPSLEQLIMGPPEPEVVEPE